MTTPEQFSPSSGQKNQNQTINSEQEKGSDIKIGNDGEIIPTQTLKDALQIFDNIDPDDPRIEPALIDLIKASQDYRKANRKDLRESAARLSSLALIVLGLALLGSTYLPESPLGNDQARATIFMVFLMVTLFNYTAISPKDDGQRVEESAIQIGFAAAALGLEGTAGYSPEKLAREVNKIVRKNRRYFNKQGSPGLKEADRLKKQKEITAIEEARQKYLTDLEARRLALRGASNFSEPGEIVLESLVELETLDGVEFLETGTADTNDQARETDAKARTGKTLSSGSQE